MASALALPKCVGARIAAEIEEDGKAGPRLARVPGLRRNTESFLRASRPTVAEIVLDTLSVDYHETIMAAAGHQAEELWPRRSRTTGQVHRRRRGLDSRPAPDGAYCTIGGRSALEIAREVCGGALATIAMGTCATFGGLPAAAPNPTALSASPTPFPASRT